MSHFHSQSLLKINQPSHVPVVKMSQKRTLFPKVASKSVVHHDIFDDLSRHKRKALDKMAKALNVGSSKLKKDQLVTALTNHAFLPNKYEDFERVRQENSSNSDYVTISNNVTNYSYDFCKYLQCGDSNKAVTFNSQEDEQSKSPIFPKPIPIINTPKVWPDYLNVDSLTQDDIDELTKYIGPREDEFFVGLEDYEQMVKDAEILFGTVVEENDRPIMILPDPVMNGLTSIVKEEMKEEQVPDEYVNVETVEKVGDKAEEEIVGYVQVDYADDSLAEHHQGEVIYDGLSELPEGPNQCLERVFIDEMSPPATPDKEMTELTNGKDGVIREMFCPRPSH